MLRYLIVILFSLFFSFLPVFSFAENVDELITAITTDQKTAFKELVDKGFDVNAANTDGLTPLMFAACSPDSEYVTILLSKGASVTTRDKVK